MPTPEAATRDVIDRQLLAAGWVVQSLATHAEDIVTPVRKEFGKGSDFCKSPSRGRGTTSSAVKAKDLIQNFRIQAEKRRRPGGVLDGMSVANGARRVSRRVEPENQFRIAVIDFVHADCASGEKESRDSRRGIVDMVATGVDPASAGPLEKRRRLVGVLDGESAANAARRVSRRAEPANQCLIFLRDVRSPLLYDQMKGRGCRSIKPTDLANVTPDAPDNRKTHFVLLDAVGVEESEKLAVSPADRRQTVTLKELIEGIRTGERTDPGDFSSLAA